MAEPPQSIASVLMTSQSVLPAGSGSGRPGRTCGPGCPAGFTRAHHVCEPLQPGDIARQAFATLEAAARVPIHAAGCQSRLA